MYRTYIPLLGLGLNKSWFLLSQQYCYTTNICYVHKYNWIVQLLFLSNETYIFFLNTNSGYIILQCFTCYSWSTNVIISLDVNSVNSINCSIIVLSINYFVGCSGPEKRRFNSNLVRVFTEEYNRSMKNSPHMKTSKFMCFKRIISNRHFFFITKTKLHHSECILSPV